MGGEVEVEGGRVREVCLKGSYWVGQQFHPRPLFLLQKEKLVSFCFFLPQIHQD